MLRWPVLAMLLCVMVLSVGCGSREIPPKADSELKPATKDSMEKALQGMPPEQRKRMEAQMKGKKF
jgi:hypothetical protein